MTIELPGIAPESTDKDDDQDVVTRAFGEENRTRLLNKYFADSPTLSAAEAWRYVYRLLMWTNRTTGLAHCYESDKTQPGRAWYPRSLVFHDWVARELSTTPADLENEIDWLFRQASADLAVATARVNRSEKVRKQREPYKGKGFPEPGIDPELEEIILDVLQGSKPSVKVLQDLIQRVQAYVTKENKRKNLLGEGFEDTLAAILRRIPGISESYDVRARSLLEEIPGFRPLPEKRKKRRVDLALVRKSDQRRILVTAKWSVRSDREEQFTADFNDYTRNESLGETFDYVLITNEFDAARLVHACENNRDNALLFNRVVHVNPEGPRVAYGTPPKHSAIKMVKLIEDGRLESLETWLTSLTNSH
jgi:hypothetical protein